MAAVIAYGLETESARLTQHYGITYMTPARCVERWKYPQVDRLMSDVAFYQYLSVIDHIGISTEVPLAFAKAAR